MNLLWVINFHSFGKNRVEIYWETAFQYFTIDNCYLILKYKLI